MSYRTREDFANQTGPTERFLRGMIRRFVVTLTDSVRWQVLGQRSGSGGDETLNVEPFTGIGFYSRPQTTALGGNPEAVTAAIGGLKNPVIVATRDEAQRKIGAGDLQPNETCVYNDQARIIVKADGTVEIRLHGGVALPLLTKADGTNLKSAISGAAVVAGDGGAAFKANILAALGAGWPVGTTQLKAQ